jgi:hypothetical protein
LAFLIYYNGTNFMKKLLAVALALPLACFSIAAFALTCPKPEYNVSKYNGWGATTGDVVWTSSNNTSHYESLKVGNFMYVDWTGPLTAPEKYRQGFIAQCVYKWENVQGESPDSFLSLAPPMVMDFTPDNTQGNWHSTEGANTYRCKNSNASACPFTKY